MPKRAIRFLIKTSEAVLKFSALKGFQKASTANKEKKMRPYKFMDRMEGELKNLEIVNTSDNLNKAMKIRRRNDKIQMDFFSAAEYAIYATNIELELTDLNGLNLYFIGIFGADIPYSKYKMKFYQDDTFSVLDTDFESMDHYLEHFDIINNDDTSYVVKKGGEQYKDSYGSSLDKSMVFLWFDSNFY